MFFRRRKSRQKARQKARQKRKAPKVTVLIPSGSDALGSGGIEYASSSHIGTRECQQDFVETGTGAEGIVFGVLCDGMGGLDDGEYASRTAAQAMASAIAEMEPNCDIHAYLVLQVERINRLIFELPSDDSQRGAVGTTLVAVVITGSDLYWLSVGDSRIYIIRRKEILSVTRDHSYSLELEAQVKQGRITAEEAASNPNRDALISYLGVDVLTLIDSNRNPFSLEPGDTVLLCSDGLFRSLDESEIVEVLERHSEDIVECARVLPLYAFDKAKGGQDNTTVILFRYQHGNQTV